MPDSAQRALIQRFAANGTAWDPTLVSTRVRFVPDPGGRHPLAVTAAYLDERSAWTVHACTGCGLTEGLDPPSVMFRSRFPDAADEPIGFTASCPVCGPSGSRTFERSAKET